MAEVPARTPVTMPAALMVAFAGVADDHVPPAVAEASVVVSPSQTASVPAIAAGKACIVTAVVAIQPVGRVYVIVAVPASTPVTTPDASTAAFVLPELQVPPGVALARAVVSPSQTVIVPVIAAGSGLTVTSAVVMQPSAEV